MTRSHVSAGLQSRYKASNVVHNCVCMYVLPNMAEICIYARSAARARACCMCTRACDMHGLAVWVCSVDVKGHLLTAYLPKVLERQPCNGA